MFASYYPIGCDTYKNEIQSHPNKTRNAGSLMMLCLNITPTQYMLDRLEYPLVMIRIMENVVIAEPLVRPDRLSTNRPLIPHCQNIQKENTRQVDQSIRTDFSMLSSSWIRTRICRKSDIALRIFWRVACECRCVDDDDSIGALYSGIFFSQNRKFTFKRITNNVCMYVCVCGVCVASVAYPLKRIYIPMGTSWFMWQFMYSGLLMFCQNTVNSTWVTIGEQNYRLGKYVQE